MASPVSEAYRLTKILSRFSHGELPREELFCARGGGRCVKPANPG